MNYLVISTRVALALRPSWNRIVYPFIGFEVSFSATKFVTAFRHTQIRFKIHDYLIRKFTYFQTRD